MSEDSTNQSFDKEAVVISFNTRADLMDLTDDDLRELGRSVVEMAADERKREKAGLRERS